MAKIDKTAIVDPKAKLADGVEIGPFCTVGPDVVIGEGTRLESHVVVKGHTEIGKNNRIFPFAAVGIEPQDLKYHGEPTKLKIGDNNTIREHCTLSTGTIQDQGVTIIGSNNLFMANVHIAHDCVVGSGTILANNVGIAGHVQVGDNAILGGQSGIHQFVRIGQGAMLSGATGMRQDVVPFCMYQGIPGKPFGCNVEGMKRHGYGKEAIHAAREVYKLTFREGKTIAEAVNSINQYMAALRDEQSKKVCELMRDFIATSQRGLAR